MQEKIDQNHQKDRNLKSYDNFKNRKNILLIKRFTFFFMTLIVFPLANKHLRAILHSIYFPAHQSKFRIRA